MNLMEQHFNELFDYSPIGLRGMDVAGVSIYTNDRIKKNLIQLVLNAPTDKQLWKKVAEHIEQDNIMAGYVSKSKRFHILKRLSMYIPMPIAQIGILAAYIPQFNKIFILLDESVNLLGKLSYDILPILKHELIHSIARNYHKEFFNISKNTFLTFYLTFFESIDKTVQWKNYTKELEDALFKVYVENEKVLAKPKNSTVSYAKTKIIWKNFFDKIDKDNLEDTFNATFCMFEYLILRNTNQDRKLLLAAYNAYKKAYKAIGVNADRHISGQEVRFLSEIICIIASYNGTLDPGIELLMRKVKLG